MNGNRQQDQLNQLKYTGWTFIVLAILVSCLTYILPYNATTYWLSVDGKQGFYVLSAFIFFLGLYCLGAIWRRQNFM